ncbi:MAG TPA: sialidase family protein [Frankiaceae bacterium]|nr:sialidase family protein [Frankiaceae bacterium]
MSEPRFGTTRIRVAVLALLGAVLVPGSGPAGAAECGGRITTTRDGWQRVAAPAFDDGSDEVTAFAVAPHDPRTMFVTNGSVIRRSGDGGCRWTQTFTTDDSVAGVPLRVGTQVREIVAAQRWTYAVVSDLATIRVFASADGGRTWADTEVPALPSGGLINPPHITTSLDGADVYLLLGWSDPASADVVYASGDGGGSWTTHPVVAGYPQEPNVVARDIAVDPLDGRSLWLSSSSGILQSLDRGATWQLRESSERGADLGPMSVTHRAGSPVQVLAGSVYEDVAYVRGNGGGLTVVNTPARVESLVGGRLVTDAVIETAEGIYELDIFNLRWAPAHRGSPRLSRLTTDYTARPRIYACACDAAGDGSIWSRVPRSFVDDPEPPEIPGDEGCAASKHGIQPAGFAPTRVTGTDEVSLQPGESRTVTYQLQVQPRELDVFFLFDSGYRAQLFACAASQGSVWAAQHLARLRNLRAGVGLYRDYPSPASSLYNVIAPDCTLGGRQPFVYKRSLRVGPIGVPLQQAASAWIEPTFCQRGHAALAGLMQAATGEGQDLPPAGGSPFDVPGNQEAGFTPDAFKVVVHVAGGTFGTPERNAAYLGPRFARVIDALVADDIKQVGIYAPPGNAKYHGDELTWFTDAETGQEDLARVARETGAVARQPVRCGPKAVVGVGDPLVCVYVDGTSGVDPDAPAMGSQIAELVKAFTDVRPMTLGVVGGGNVVVDAAPPAARNADHLLPQTLSHTVTYRCRPSAAGEVREVEVGGHVGGELVAKTKTVVRCGAPPAAVRPLPDEFVPFAPPVVQLVAPVAPQLPPNNIAPNTAPQPNAQSQNVAQGVAAGAAVPQEETEPRLAYADIGEARPQYGDELEMSALPRRAPYDVPAWMVVEVALLTSAAGAYAAYRRRTAAQPQVRRQRF